nr:MAG TPA: holin [Caudoviricetes sp.]
MKGENTMFDVLNELICPELLVLVPVLYLIGFALKKSTFKDKHIPWLLGVVGILLSTVYLIANSEVVGWRDVLAVLFAGITQGVLVTGASVYVNQLVKQKGEKE